MEKRFETIETTVAFLEHNLEELSSVVYKQGQYIELLELKISRLEERSRMMEENSIADAKSDTPPPHY